MCTAITYTTKDNYFGRNLDLDFSYNETVTICPRNYPFSFRHQGENNSHFAMIGMATVQIEIQRRSFQTGNQNLFLL